MMADETTDADLDETTEASQEDAVAAAEAAAGESEQNADVRRANEEAKRYRLQLRAAEKRIQEFESSQLSDSEKRDRELADIRGERDTLQNEIRSLRVQTSASRAGFTDPEDAAALLTWDDSFDDPKALTRALKELLARKPHLGAAAADVDAGARGSSVRTESMNDLIRRAAGRS